MKQIHIEDALRQARGVLARGGAETPAARQMTVPRPAEGESSVGVLALLQRLPLPLVAQAITAFLDSLKPNASWWQRIALDTVKALLAALVEQAGRPTTT